MDYVEHGLLNREKYTLDINIHDLIPPVPLVHGLKLTPPRRTRIRKQDIHVVRMFPYFGDQALDLADLGAVGGDGDGLGPRGLVGEGVEGGDGGGACGCFARGDEDFGTAGLEEPGWG
jgi:hypothetical protein